MFSNLNVLFFMMIFFSSILSISSSNWLGVWLGLEFNMLSFIPLLINNNNILPNESALKYFIIQAAASTLFLFICIFQSTQNSFFWNFNMNFILNLFLIISLMLKLGAAPFQSWFIMVIQGLDWFKSLILLTWQKMAPLFIMTYTFFNCNYMMMIATISSIVGALGGLNQTHLKKILAFSSVNHLGWLFMILHLNNNLLKYYFLIYMFMVSFCVAFIQANSLNKINQMFTNSQKMIFIISFLSLGGLPPFLGFFPKWMVIQQLMQNNFFLINFILIMTALMTLFYYLQIIMTLLTFNFSNQMWMIFSENKINVMVFLMSTLTCLGLIFSNINLI